MSPIRTVRFVLRSMQNQGTKLPCHSKAPSPINGSEGWQAFSYLKKHYYILECNTEYK